MLCCSLSFPSFCQYVVSWLHFSPILPFCCCFSFPYFYPAKASRFIQSFLSIQTMSHCESIQQGLVQTSENPCVKKLVSQRAHWAAIRPLGLKFATFDPWETLTHNDAGEQCSPSSVCSLWATAHCRSYDLSWIHLPTGKGPLPSGLAL